MKQKEITIAGKQTNVCYCYATEIAYKDLAGEDLTDFIQEAVMSIQQERMPDIKKSIYLILAAMMAHEQATGTKADITDNDLMVQATPSEFGTALGTVIALRSEFYHIPTGEPEDKPEKQQKGKGRRKNA